MSEDFGPPIEPEEYPGQHLDQTIGGLVDERDKLRHEIATLRAEIERMKAVYEAAAAETDAELAIGNASLSPDNTDDALRRYQEVRIARRVAVRNSRSRAAVREARGEG